jgi:hypothetical protein
MGDRRLGEIIAAPTKRQAAGLPVVENADVVMDYLSSPKFESAAMVAMDKQTIVLDLSIGSLALGVPLKNIPVDRFSELVDQAMQNAGTEFAFGRWGEPRELYSSELFVREPLQNVESRSIHMGIDVFCAADTPVNAPLDGRVHLKANNAAELDYGPLIVLEHKTPTGELFYTLYGHLSMDGVAHIEEGQQVYAGDRIASIGSAPENGNWPPHLHFQLILDWLDLNADFPGVALRSQQDVWLGLSPLPGMFFPECATSLLDGSDIVGATVSDQQH